MRPTMSYIAGKSRQVSPSTRNADEWEEWEDDDVITPIDTAEQVLIQSPPPAPPSTSQYLRPVKSLTSRGSRLSSVKLKRLKSRQRQQAQNAKAGIKLITDMSALRHQNQVAQQVRGDTKGTKFVDAAALRALEGEPNSASVGNWNWLKREKTQSPAPASPKQTSKSPNQELSPEDRPIVIGIAVPPGEAKAYQVTPLTATANHAGTGLRAETSASLPDTRPAGEPQSKSVWSPDTPDTICSFNSARPPSSVYSQMTNAPMPPSTHDAPPVPALPASYKKVADSRVLSLQLANAHDEEEAGTPCTLFEEDGISPLKSAGVKMTTLTPDSAGSRAYGWWDHVVSPFADRRLSFASRKQKMDSPKSGKQDKFWVSSTTEKGPSQPSMSSPCRALTDTPLVRAPTPRRTPPPRSNTVDVTSSSLPERTSSEVNESHTREKVNVIFTDELSRTSLDHPPPYSPQKKNPVMPVRYRAVFPPSHPLHNQFPPTPRPASPGLAGTMTSQASPHLAEVPLSPPPRVFTPSARAEPVPHRQVGTYLPEAHSYSARGHTLRVERKRRRHEKEEMMARRVGGFWRGRGCIPNSNCFGRTGREGRQRRRVWFGVCAGITALIVLAIVLSVVLTRHHVHQDLPSIWVNLTDFPPMPTGVLTVVGPDNTVARSGCSEPSTLWSCSLPKEQHESVAPYKANQPTVILQIQWDNSTKKDWKIPNGTPPPSLTKRGEHTSSITSDTTNSTEVANGFKPSPDAPDFQEMWFLGETTDSIQSDEKAGEPTPFYISVLSTVEEPIATPKLDKRADNLNFSALVHPPELEQDGTPSPAVMIPQPTQQPVRLFDRGLPTEHYGFYAHFRRTIFLKSVTVLNETDTDENNIPLDEDGGCTKSEANFLTTWGETRLLVRIWTQKLSQNTSSLLRPDEDTAKLHRPGTMPYPVTVTLDTHGGDPTQKLTWRWPIDDRQHINASDVKFLVNNMAVGGTWLNRRASGDAKFGGFDGGTGGCKCEWVNWV